jgi:hypothetical protein
MPTMEIFLLVCVDFGHMELTVDCIIDVHVTNTDAKSQEYTKKDPEDKVLVS